MMFRHAQMEMNEIYIESSEMATSAPASWTKLFRGKRKDACDTSPPPSAKRVRPETARDEQAKSTVGSHKKALKAWKENWSSPRQWKVWRGSRGSWRARDDGGPEWEAGIKPLKINFDLHPEQLPPPGGPPHSSPGGMGKGEIKRAGPDIPLLYQFKGNQKPEYFVSLNQRGFTFVEQCIKFIESDGLNTKGLFRVEGVSSKVSRLLSVFFDEASAAPNLVDLPEVSIRTVTSALKTYFRSLPEPLITSPLRNDLVAVLKNGDKSRRVKTISTLVRSLPAASFRMLSLIIRHFANVAGHADTNEMTVTNLAVCVGPTLLRPEKLAGAVDVLDDVKIGNMVVELLINYEMA